MFDQQFTRLSGTDDNLELPFGNLAIAVFKSPDANKLSQRQRVNPVSLQLSEHFPSFCSSSGHLTLSMERDGVAQRCLGRRSASLRGHRGLQTRRWGERLGAVSLPALGALGTRDLLT